MTPLGTVFLKLDRILNEEIILNGGIKLFLDPRWNPEWNASVTGVVAALPVNHPANVEIGDEVAFSYRVVADRTPLKADYFQPMIEPMPFYKRYINSKGDKLTIVAMPGVISKIWAATLVDKFGNLIAGEQGSESAIERWMSQFNFSNAADFKFNNLFNFNGRDYWKADLDDIFAKRVKGKVQSIGDRIICTPVEEDIKHKIELIEGKPLPYQSVKIQYRDRGRVVSGGEELDIQEGQVISFEEKYMEMYEFWGKKYFLIKKHRVNGIWE